MDVIEQHFCAVFRNGLFQDDGILHESFGGFVNIGDKELDNHLEYSFKKTQTIQTKLLLKTGSTG